MSEPRPLALVHAVLGELFPERRGSVQDGALIGALTQPGRAGALAARSAGRGGGYRRVDAAAYLGAAAGRPEAMVKIIVKGGCASAAELRSQIAYIAREGDVDMYGAAAFGLDHPLSAADLEDTIAAWQEGWTGASRYGETLHMIVSYPIGSAPDTVWAAGRDFAEIAFGSGDYGDSWDYLAALHTDMAHPHVHLIVNRRGFDHGTLLATYKGSLLNVDELRRLQAGSAREHGIEMTATPRLARGLSDIAPGTSAYRRALEHGVTAGRRSRTTAALSFAEKAMARHAQVYDRLAEIFTAEHRDQVAVLLRECGGMLKRGDEIMTEPEIAKAEDFETLAEARAKILTALDRAETEIHQIKNPEDRARRERRLGALKGRAAAYAPDRADLAAFAAPVPRGAALYRSDALAAFQARPVSDLPGIAAVRAHVAERAREAGLDPRVVIARFEAGGPQEAGTAALWAAQDMVAVLKARGIAPDRADQAAIRAAAREIDRVHDHGSAAYAGVVLAAQRKAQDRTTTSEHGAGQGDPLAAERLSLLGRAARAALDASRDRPATLQEIGAERAYVDAIDRLVTRAQKAQLERGDPGALAETLKGTSRTETAELTLTYLEARRDLTDEQTRGQYAAAIRSARRALTAARVADRQMGGPERGRDDGREL